MDLVWCGSGVRGRARLFPCATYSALVFTHDSSPSSNVWSLTPIHAAQSSVQTGWGKKKEKNLNPVSFMCCWCEHREEAFNCVWLRLTFTFPARLTGPARPQLKEKRLEFANADLGLIDSFVHAPVLKLLRQPSPLPRFHRFHNCHQHNDTVAVATVSLFSLSLARTHKERKKNTHARTHTRTHFGSRRSSAEFKSA